MTSLKMKSLYIGVLLIFSGLLLSFGKKEIQLQKNIPITADEVYKLLQTNAGFQIIDVRPYGSDESEDENTYYEAHIPGSIPFPNCDESKTPKEALEHINPYLPTIIVSQNGDVEIFKKCAQRFTIVKNLKGGFAAWNEKYEDFNEDDEYSPPIIGSPVGCLGGNKISVVYSW